MFDELRMIWCDSLDHLWTQVNVAYTEQQTAIGKNNMCNRGLNKVLRFADMNNKVPLTYAEAKCRNLSINENNDKSPSMNKRV